MSCVFQVGFIIAAMIDAHVTIPSGCMLATFLVLMMLIGTVEPTGRRGIWEYWLL